MQAASESKVLWESVVWQDPDRMGGAPCFAGSRVPVRTLFDYLEAGDSLDDFLDAFPGITREQVCNALRCGKDRLVRYKALK